MIRIPVCHENLSWQFLWHARKCFNLSLLVLICFFLVAIAQGGTIQIANPGADGVQGLQTLTMTNAGTPQPGTTIVQYATQSSDGTQQFFVPGSQVVVQGMRNWFIWQDDNKVVFLRKTILEIQNFVQRICCLKIHNLDLSHPSLAWCDILTILWKVPSIDKCSQLGKGYLNVDYNHREMQQGNGSFSTLSPCRLSSTLMPLNCFNSDSKQLLTHSTTHLHTKGNKLWPN